MAVSEVAEDFRDAFRRLFFLLVLVSTAHAGLDECFELFHESLSHVFREPFLAAPASYWYRLSQPHRQDASSLLSPIEAPMVDFAYGSADLVHPIPAYTGSLGHPHLLRIDEASKYRGDPDYHQANKGLTVSVAMSIIDDESQQPHAVAPLSSIRTYTSKPASLLVA